MDKRGGETIEGLFEVEHSTTTSHRPKSRFTLVSDENRRGLFARQFFRPTLRNSGLAVFLECSNVLDWHMRLAKRGADKQARLGD